MQLNIVSIDDNLFIVTIDKPLNSVDDCDWFELKAVCSKVMLLNELENFCFSEDDISTINGYITEAEQKPTKLISNMAA